MASAPDSSTSTPPAWRQERRLPRNRDALLDARVNSFAKRKSAPRQYKMQTLGTLFSLASAVQDGHVACDEIFLRTVTSDILRIFGAPEPEIPKAVAELPPPPIADTGISIKLRAVEAPAGERE